MRQGALESDGIRHVDHEQWANFEKRLFYMVGDPSNIDFYRQLGAKLEEMHQAGSSTNHLFYVSTPASVAAPIIEGLGSAGLNRNDQGWSRIVLEKPFGRDLESARQLNQTVLRTFDESNIYRIDHYLGKETVQNILVFRFGNSLFEPVWNRNYVDYVEITAAETVGVENRASFYEETGALRDMVANHMLASITHFREDAVVQIEKAAGLKDIELACDPYRVSENVFYALRVDGVFDAVHVRAVHPVPQGRRTPSERVRGFSASGYPGHSGCSHQEIFA